MDRPALQRRRWSVAGASCRQSEGLVEQQRPPAARRATMQSTRRNTLIKAFAYFAAVRAARRRARAIDHRPEHFLVERVAADAEIGIGLAVRHACPRTREEVLDAPAVGEAHALGMTCRNRFERGLPDQ